MEVRLTWTDGDKAGDYVVPNVLSPRDIVSRPDNTDETVLSSYYFMRMNSKVKTREKKHDLTYQQGLCL